MATQRKAKDVLNEINAAFGKGTVMLANDPYLKVTYLPTGVAPIDDLLQGGLPFGRFVEIFGDYCVSPETKILTDALQWVDAGNLEVDYGLVGFEEELNQGRGRASKMLPSQVQLLGEKKLQCVRIVTARGEITCSVGHGFVAYNNRTKQREWRKARDVRVGDELLWTAEPWETDSSRDAGWAAGIIDGEGWLDGKRLQIGQNPGYVLDEFIRVMKERGFELDVMNQSKHNNVMRASIHGGRWETMRALGQLKSVRFLSRGVEVWDGADLSSKGPFTVPGSNKAKVLAVEILGKQDVVTMQTSSRTFIADGFPSHNSTLKSYVGLCAIRECQKAGKLACLIDTEHAFDPQWAKDIGVDLEELIYKQPTSGEQAIDVAELMIRGGVDLIVFDSVAAALPQAEQKKKMEGENVQPARLAQLMSLAMRKLTAANSKTAVLWINQTRVNVGVMFGSNEAVPGGKALPFYASFRIAVRKAGKVTEDIEVHVTEQGTVKRKKIKQTVAQTIRTTLEKSKLNQPHREVLFNFDFRRGEVDGWLYLVHKALDQDIITTERKKWWLTNDPTKKYPGIEAMRKEIPENELRALLEIPTTVVPPPKPDPWHPSHGATKPAKKRVASPKPASSKRVVRVSTRAVVRAVSKKTVVPKTNSSKSKTR